MADGALQPPRCCSFFGTNGLYDAVGNLDDFVYPNGVKHAYTYTEQNRLKNLTLTRGDSTLLRSFSYQLSAAGHRVGVAETNLVEGTPVQWRRVAYEYDRDNWGGPAPARVYRLTRESLFAAEDTATGSVTHAYDKVGNRTARTANPPIEAMPDQSFAFDRRDLLDGDGDPDNANDRYDANGNTVKDESGNATEDVYDAENRLIQRGSAIRIAYDHEGNRVWKVGNGVTNCYLLDERNPSGYVQVLAEYASDSTQPPTLSRSYAYGQDLISQVIHSSSFNPQPLTNYYGCDGQGSVRLLTDATSAAAVTDTYDYGAYGVLLGISGTTPNHYRYTGEQWDSELGMYSLRARYYKPHLGRFWTMDSFGGSQNDPLSLHKYLYCHGNPVNLTDPSGERVYVATRPLNIDYLRRVPRLAVHVFLVFDEYQLSDKKAWRNLVASEDSSAKSANSYGIMYRPDPQLTTFSYHPRSVFTHNNSENTWFTAATPGSYVEYNGQIDKEAFGTPGRDKGYQLFLVTDDDQSQQELFKFAAQSRNKNNNGTPDPCNYDFGRFNCGSWVDYVLKNNGFEFPDRSLNEGVGLGGSLSGVGEAVTTAAYLARYRCLGPVLLTTFGSMPF